jgi:hypothetical protein
MSALMLAVPFQNAVEPALPGRRHCPLEGVTRPRRGAGGG